MRLNLVENPPWDDNVVKNGNGYSGWCRGQVHWKVVECRRSRLLGGRRFYRLVVGDIWSVGRFDEAPTNRQIHEAMARFFSRFQ